MERTTAERLVEPEEVGECVVCHGRLMPRMVTELDARFGPMAIGPGSSGQRRQRHDGYYCTNIYCGIRYEFIPQKPPVMVDDLMEH